MSKVCPVLCGLCTSATLLAGMVRADSSEQRWAKARQAAFTAILSPELAQLYEALPDSAARARWEERYWRMVDPLPSSGENPYREEFERRFAYAWQHFSTVVGPTYLDDRARYYVRYGPPDDFVESVGGGRKYLDNLTWAYFGLNLFVDFVRRPGFGYQEVNDLSQAVTGAPLNEKVRIASELYGEREVLHQRYAAFRNTGGNTHDYFAVASNLLSEKTQALNVAPPSRFSFRYSQEPLDVHITSACFRGESGATRVEFYYSVPLNQVTYVPGEQSSLVSHLIKRLVIYDEEYQPVVRREETLELRAESHEQVAGKSYVNQHDEALAPGLYNVAFELECPESRRLAVIKSQLRVRSFAGDSLMVSDLQLSLRVLEGAVAKHLKPNGVLVVPTVQRLFQRGKPFFVYFEIYNLMLDEAGSSDYQLEYVLRTAEGGGLLDRLSKVVSFLAKDREAQAVGMSFRSEGKERWEQRYVQLDMSRCPAGRAELVVTVTDRHTGQQASGFTSFELE